MSDYCPTRLPFVAMDEAARLDNVDVMEWFATHHTIMVRIYTYSAQATINGTLEALQWLECNSGLKCPSHAMSTVVDTGGSSGR